MTFKSQKDLGIQPLQYSGCWPIVADSWEAGSSTTKATSKQPGSNLGVSMVRCICSGIDGHGRRPRDDSGVGS